MRTTQRMLMVAAVVVMCLASVAVADDTPKPALDEGQLRELVRLMISDDAVIKRIAAGGIDFEPTDQSLARLKKDGASEAVLNAVTNARVVGLAKAPVMELWVERPFTASSAAAFHTELSIDGKKVDVFTTDTKRSLKDLLAPEKWHTFTFKTTPAKEAKGGTTGLTFTIGEVRKEGEKVVMSPLWVFSNDENWEFKDGQYFHRSDPDAKEATVSFRVFYAGPEPKSVPARRGDYVLTAKCGPVPVGIPTSGVTATVTITDPDGKQATLNTFMGAGRNYVITPYLKKGENKIKIVTSPLSNTYALWDIKFEVGGPVTYNPATGQYEYQSQAKFEAMNGWTVDEKTGLLVNKANPKAGEIVREITLKVEEDLSPSRK